MGFREFLEKQKLRNSISSIPGVPLEETAYPIEEEIPSVDDDDELVRENPRKLAAMIKRKPAPKGALGVKIGGRPIDLHQLEKYLVWQISPYILSTINAYNSSRQIEQMQNYRRRGFSQAAEKKGSGRIIMYVILLSVVIGIGVLMVMYMPSIMNFFRGFGGGF